MTNPSKFTSSQIIDPVASSEIIPGTIPVYIRVNKRLQNQVYCKMIIIIIIIITYILYKEIGFSEQY